MNWRNYIFILLTLSWSELQAQSLKGLQENQVIKNHLAGKRNALKSAQGKSILSLPFFEDFTTTSVFPDPAKWSDKYVFINNSFAIDPISFGVATLDAIDDKGEVYAISNRPTSSDTLTSHDFDLSVYEESGESVRLSFFYQCGGNGETPELNDSLLLEIYKPSTDQWIRIWYANMNESSAFLQEIIEIPDSFYVDGFRFRFRNYTSMSAGDVSGGKGALSNADCWNIDYIMMNTESLFAHQVIDDIMLTDTPRKLLDYYEIIPWLHLNDAQPVIARNEMNFDIRNLLQAGNFINIGRSYYLKYLDTGFLENYELFNAVFPTDTLIHESDPFFATFARRDDSKEGRIEVVSYLETTAGEYNGNDSSRIILHFRDAYAFDDGTPEYGFGIEGPSMNGALLALRFRLFKTDTLRAVDMLFNKAQNNFNADLKFQLCVWNDGGGKPGDLLYMSTEEFSPDSSLETTGFKRYPVQPDENLIITDTVVYIGWKQLTDEFLNLGYDVNRNNLSRTYVNVAGNWINPGGSLIPGTVMMRAVFGGKDVISGSPEIPGLNSSLVAYPNPANHILHIGPEETDIRSIMVFDMSGRIVKHQTGNVHSIDVSSLAAGVYQVLIYTKGTQPPVNRKILISH